MNNIKTIFKKKLKQEKPTDTVIENNTSFNDDVDTDSNAEIEMQVVDKEEKTTGNNYQYPEPIYDIYADDTSENDHDIYVYSSEKNIEINSSQMLASSISTVNDESPYQADYFKNSLQEFGFIMSGMMGQFLSQAGLSQTLSIMNVLTSEFHSTTGQAWLMSSFPLTCGSFILISGRFGDIYGLKKVYLFGYMFLTIWCLISGLSSYAQ